VELGVKVEGTSISVPEELFLEGEPCLSAHVCLIANDVLYLDGDGCGRTTRIIPCHTRL
jgi:hypothetical protein